MACILNGTQGAGLDPAGLEIIARAQQLGRPQQAADMVGAKGRIALGDRCHVASPSEGARVNGPKRNGKRCVFRLRVAGVPSTITAISKLGSDMPQIVDISEVLERRKPDAFNVRVTILAFLVVLFDGYDLTVLGYAAPSLIKSWGITNFAALAPAFSASLFGVLLGSPIYGFVGDKFGRKLAIILAALNVGILTLAAVWATGLDQLVVLRFLAGIGIGGMLPNLFALNAEFAARRNRTTAIVLVNCGVAGGAGIPGIVSALLVPSHGWEILFYIGGIIPIVMACVALLWLPESIRFLALNAGRQEELRRLMARSAPP